VSQAPKEKPDFCMAKNASENRVRQKSNFAGCGQAHRFGMAGINALLESTGIHSLR
jgi:hypothetical protein